jgi:hypothetical protein
MTKNAKSIVVGANGEVYVADVDAAVLAPPTDAATPLNTGTWTEVGFVSEGGVQVTPGQTITPIMAWQSAYPVRKIVTARSLELDFAMREFNLETIPFAFGGGSLTEPHKGQFRFVPPQPEETDPRAMVIQWRDQRSAGNLVHYRLYVPNGQVTTLSAFTVSRTAPAELPVKFELNFDGISNGGNAWSLFSDDNEIEGS